MTNRRSFTEYLPAVAILVSALLLVLILCVLDLLTGPQLSFSIFYLLPIYLVTWRLGRGSGYVLSLISAVAWLIADTFEGYAHSLIPYWNMVVRLAFFLLTAHLVSALKTAEHRRRALERIFYHDILNVAGSIRGFAELLQTHPDIEKKDIYHWLQVAAEQSIDQIENQRALASAEHGDLSVEPTVLNSIEIVRQVIQFYRHHPAGKHRDILLDRNAEGITFTSDQALIHRILGNLAKNALEASPAGKPVVIGCRSQDDGVEFSVHNFGVVPEPVRNHIFRISVTTKGAGRGLGTYSIHVLSRCLKGKASFTSSEEEGTTFRVWFPLEYQKNA